MTILDKLNQLKDERSYSNPAKSIKNLLLPLVSQWSNYSQRWIWELLQNASDLGDNIKVKIELDNTKLTFSHNGRNFTLSEAYNFIMPFSSKDNEETKSKSVIGQFGTGFISTHILSRVVHLSGVIEEDNELYSFNYHLDRSEKSNNDFLVQSIKESEIEYKKNLTRIDNLPKDSFQTLYTYNIKNTFNELNGFEIVKNGIESLKELIPFVFAFRPQLNEIQIIDNREDGTIFKFSKGEITSNIEELQILKTQYFKNGEHVEDRLTGIIIEEQTEIAFPLQLIEENKFKLLPFPKKCPKIFCAFPLIGTSEFNFPVVIHSEKIYPNRERNGLEISEYEPNDLENRERLIEAKDAFLKLLKIIEDYEWSNAYNICKLVIPDIEEEETKKWFTKNIFNDIKKGLNETKLIELDSTLKEDESRISISSAYIPYADKRKKDKEKTVSTIYELAFTTIPNTLPKKEDYYNWYDNLDFEIFDTSQLTVEDLCPLITSRTNLLDFANKHELTEDGSIKYLIKLVQFIISQDAIELLNSYKLLLNQSNEFVKVSVLKLDHIDHQELENGYDEKLKDIYNSLSNKNCRNFLLHKAFETIKDLIDSENKYLLEDLARDTDEKLRNYIGNYQDDEFRIILRDLFHWYTNCGLPDEILANLFPYFSSNRSQLYFNTKTAQELEFAFDIEISGKSQVLAKIAKSSLSENELEIIITNPELVSSFIEWLTNKQTDNPDKELGNIGEEFLNHQLCKIFGKERVLWEDKSEYDFRILENDLENTKYFIDAKTTGRGMANSDNVPFFMRTAQWTFLDIEQAFDKYIIARIFKSDDNFEIKYIKLNKQALK